MRLRAMVCGYGLATWQPTTEDLWPDHLLYLWISVLLARSDSLDLRHLYLGFSVGREGSDLKRRHRYYVLPRILTVSLVSDF